MRLLLALFAMWFVTGCGDDAAQASASDFGVDVGNIDTDSDGVQDNQDNCPQRPNPDQADLDEDGVGDECDPDDDGDGVIDEADGCPRLPDPQRGDHDEDGLGDACDDDDDNDGVADDVDLCPFDASDNGQDQDGDGLGDPCDFDIDGDEVLNEDDNCPSIANTAQEDLDEDGLGDGCDDDTDGDEVLDSEDNCRSAVNPEQADLDLDGVGDVCDDETDGDGLVDTQDNCPMVLNPDQADVDQDGIGDACDDCPNDANNDEDGDALCADVDNCPLVDNADQLDSDMDGLGTACDVCPLDPLNDEDEDGICGSVDNCIAAENADQADSDRDGAGDACDVCPLDEANDHDQDGVCGDVDICPLAADPDQLDTDDDGLGDECDVCPSDPLNDGDADSVCDDRDNCPDITNPQQADLDGDGIGDACDECVAAGPTDPDGDAVCGVSDNCPSVANVDQIDRDDDGFGDECDVCANDPDNDIDGDGICGDLDTCPNVYDPAQQNDDGDGFGNACDIDYDNDGVADADDNCPLAVNPGQEDTFGDERGDACEDLYFVDDFENGLAQWNIVSGEWNTSVEAAFEGNFGLVDTFGLSNDRTTYSIRTLPFSLANAYQPRLSFLGRFDVADSFFVVEIRSGAEVRERIDLVGAGNVGREPRAYQIDLNAYAGLESIVIELRFRTERTNQLGVWIDSFRVDERPFAPSLVLPLREDFDSLARWHQFGGEFTLTRQAWSGESGLQHSAFEGVRKGESILQLNQGVDLRGVESPELSFWMKHGDFGADCSLIVHLLPSDPDVLPVTVRPVTDGSNGYFERFRVDMSALAGDPDVRVQLRYYHYIYNAPELFIDELQIYDAAGETVSDLPQEYWIPDERIAAETGGWGIVEEPLGQPALRSSATGLNLDSEVRLNLGTFNFDDAVEPMLSVWTRYALRANRQRFFARITQGGLVNEVAILEPTAQDMRNGQFERIDVDLTAFAGLGTAEIELVVTTGNDGYFGVDISRVYLGEPDAAMPVAGPVYWDFDESNPTLQAISGRWTNAEIIGRDNTDALRLVSRLGLRGLPSTDIVRFSPAVDLSSLDRPEMSLWLKHFFASPQHELKVRIRTVTRGQWTEVLSRATGDIHVRSDGYQKYTIPLDSVAGATAATIELIATTSSNLPLDVAVDDIRIESRAAVPLAVLNVDANDAYTVFLNGDEVGTGREWLAAESYDLRLQPGANVIAFEVDGTGVGPSMVASMTFGSLVLRTGETGWKSSTIQMDGSIEEDWMTLGFDSVPWANVPTDGPDSNSVSPSYLGLRRELRARFVSNPDGGTRQYFRRLFTLEDADQDQIPDAVDLCPLDPTGPERDSNGNGIGDSCDFCVECPNLAFGKPVAVSSVSGEASQVTDGQASMNGWRANGNTGWARVDLGDTYSVCSARWFGSNFGNFDRGIRTWRMAVRDVDGEEVIVGEGFDEAGESNNLPRVVDFGLCYPARYVTFYIDTGHYGRAALGELQVYGEPL